MAPSLSFMEKSKKWLFSYSQDPGKMLLHTATLGWIFSSAGQIFGIANNKEISKKEKRFLIPQEIADAAINIISFYVLTDSVQKFSKSLVAKGKIITPKIKQFCLDNGIRITKNGEGKTANIGEDISKKIKEYKTLLELDKNEKVVKSNLSENQINEIQKKIKKLTHFKDETYGPFESGLKVVGNIVGGVVSGNILTPMLRNPIAAYKQKNSMEREKMEHDAKLYNENRVILAQNQVGQDKYRSAVNPYPTSGSMKI